MEKVAVVQCLQPKIIKIQVTFRMQGCSQPVQVKLQKSFVKQLSANPSPDKPGKVVNVSLRHIGGRNIALQHFARNRVKQESSGCEGVIRVLFDQRPGCQNGCFVDFIHGHAVVQVAHGLGQNGFGLHICAKSFAGARNQELKVFRIERNALPSFQYMQLYRCRCRASHDLGAFLRAAFTVQNVGTSDFVVAPAHQTQFDLILNIFNMKSATCWA